MVKTGSKDRVAIINPQSRVAYCNKHQNMPRPATETKYDNSNAQNLVQQNVETSVPDSDQKYEINQEMELQKTCFGDELSMISTTQQDENFTMILDRNEKETQ